MRRYHPYELSHLSLEDWKHIPFAMLRFDVKKSWLAPLISQVKDELRAKSLAPFFHTWVSDEWFSPDGCPGIALPYYLFHPSLIRLQKQSGLPVEGATKAHALKLIRHEVGHAIENAWRLRRYKMRQKLFGTSGTPYPTIYTPNTSSNSFVHHLGDHYAQSHPDEDWAETFALWLSTSKRTWERQYAGTLALTKLQYCDQVMSEISSTRPLNSDRFVVSPIEDTRGTIGSFMQTRANSRAKSIVRTLAMPNSFKRQSSHMILHQAPAWLEQEGLGILM